MSAHHVDLPEQVVTPGEELWVKIIDLDLQRRRISLSIKQAAEGGVVAAEYQEAFGEHMYDAEGNYIGPSYEYNPDELTEDQQAWAEYYAQHPELDPNDYGDGGPNGVGLVADAAAEGEAPDQADHDVLDQPVDQVDDQVEAPADQA